VLRKDPGRAGKRRPYLCSRRRPRLLSWLSCHRSLPCTRSTPPKRVKARRCPFSREGRAAILLATLMRYFHGTFFDLDRFPDDPLSSMGMEGFRSARTSRWPAAMEIT